eukprot:jgi/Hompol1/1788/HPOL_001968-RA
MSHFAYDSYDASASAIDGGAAVAAADMFFNASHGVGHATADLWPVTPVSSSSLPTDDATAAASPNGNSPISAFEENQYHYMNMRGAGATPAKPGSPLTFDLAYMQRAAAAAASVSASRSASMAPMASLAAMHHMNPIGSMGSLLSGTAAAAATHPMFMRPSFTPPSLPPHIIHGSKWHS